MPEDKKPEDYPKLTHENISDLVDAGLKSVRELAEKHGLTAEQRDKAEEGVMNWASAKRKQADKGTMWEK